MIEEEIVGVESLVPKKLKDASVEVVSARFCDQT